jgi:hypothetical protein
MSEEDEELKKLEGMSAEDDIDEIYAYMISGDAKVSFKSKKTNVSYSYQLKKSNDGALIFVSILIEDNEKWPYKYFGFINKENEFIHGRQGKAKIDKDHPGAVAFQFGWTVLSEGLLHKDLEFRRIQ